MIDQIRIGHAASPHGTWMAGWVKEQLLHNHPTINIDLIPVTKSLTDFARQNVISKLLTDVDLVVADGSFLPTVDDPGVVVAAVCERADPRHCIVGDGNAVSVWHPSLASVLSVTDPTVSVDIIQDLIDINQNDTSELQSHQRTTMMPLHAVTRVQSQQLGQTPIEAEDILSVCGQGTVLVYSKVVSTELGTLVFENVNAVDTRREITVERFFKSQLKELFHNGMCCYATGSDRFLYLFVTLIVNKVSYRTRSGAHISALGSIVDQAIADLEQQTGAQLRLEPTSPH
ncbi:MAG: hypothetical protein ACKO14_14185 [Armatimonadota bacterium]